MILSCNFEELGALRQGARAVLGEGPGEGVEFVAPVVAPPEGQEEVEGLLPRLSGDLAIETLAEQRLVFKAVTAIVSFLRDEMDLFIISAHPADEAAVCILFRICSCPCRAGQACGDGSGDGGSYRGRDRGPPHARGSSSVPLPQLTDSMSEDRLDTLKRMAKERPDDSRLQFGLAVELLNRGETQAGVAPLRSYLANAEDDGNGWGRLGAALAELGEVGEAREAYEKGIDIAKGRGHFGLAEEFQEALEDLT